MKAISLLPIIAVLLLGSMTLPSVYAQIQAGGVDKEGTWYAGEGLKQGDYFSYSMCHVDYKDCTQFDLDLWIKGDIKVGTETKWVAEAVVYDGSKIVVGEIHLGKIAPEPTGGSEELGVYRGAFKSSIVWLSAFATSDDRSGGKGPKAFSDISWGKIANIGGEQVVPQALETITTPAGTWETVVIGWKTGGATSKVWIVDDFPFPVKAKTYVHTNTGIPPVEYEFTLIEYRQDVQKSPFESIVSTKNEGVALGCETNFAKDTSIKKPTHDFNYQLHIFYGPEDPVQGCEMQWIIEFISKYNDAERLNQVQFDVYVVNDEFDWPPLRSIAQEAGKEFLYSQSGQYILDFVVREKPGIANYVIWINGLAPDWAVPTSSPDYLEISIPIFAADKSFTPPSVPNTDPETVPDTDPETVPDTDPETVLEIPDWVKNNAGWWADGTIDDASFVGVIQYLIENGIMKIPPTTQGESGTGEIPDWIKNNAGWWADGTIDDASFVGGIQYLIEKGILNISS